MAPEINKTNSSSMLPTLHYDHQHKKQEMKANQLLSMLLLSAVVCKSILEKKLFSYDTNQCS
jgi:hypothetical protein